MIVAAVVIVALAAIVAQLVLARSHAGHVAELLARQDAERYAWAKERWELNTRIQAPEIARVAPPAPPAPAEASDDAVVDEDDVDESHLVGTIG